MLYVIGVRLPIDLLPEIKYFTSKADINFMLARDRYQFCQY